MMELYVTPIAIEVAMSGVLFNGVVIRLMIYGSVPPPWDKMTLQSGNLDLVPWSNMSIAARVVSCG